VDLQRIEREGGDVEDYCVELAGEDPVLYAWLLVEHCPGETLEAVLNILWDCPELLVTYH